MARLCWVESCMKGSGGKPEGWIDHLEDVGVDGRIILKLNLQK